MHFFLKMLLLLSLYNWSCPYSCKIFWIYGSLIRIEVRTHSQLARIYLKFWNCWKAFFLSKQYHTWDCDCLFLLVWELWRAYCKGEWLWWLLSCSASAPPDPTGRLFVLLPAELVIPVPWLWRLCSLVILLLLLDPSFSPSGIELLSSSISAPIVDSVSIISFIRIFFIFL